jgi:hypothetical protein
MSIDTLEIFQKKFYPDAVRSNLFYIYINFPTFILNSSDARTKTKWLVQAASLPGRSLGVIEVPFRGVKSKYAGNSIYADWSATFLQDPSFTITNAMEAWMEYIESIPAGIRAVDISYKSTIEIVQLDGRQNAIKNYVLIGAFPSDKPDVSLAQDENDSVQMADFTLSYDYFITSVSL